jgi:CheY-like chemotaxis protein
MSRTDGLSGCRILVAEDEAAISLLVESILSDQGVIVVGPGHDVTAAQHLINEHTIDCALLDIRLGEQTVYAVAETLRARGIPIIFVTGYSHIDDSFRDAPVIQKPFEPADVENALAKVLAARP